MSETGLTTTHTPVKRYFASVWYVVAGAEHMILDWGPHKEPPVVRSPVAVRYRIADPSVAKVWTEFNQRRYLWVIAPVVICIAVEVLALRAWLG